MAEYAPIYTRPYENGWVNAPPEETPVTAEILDAYDIAVENIEGYLRDNPIRQPETASDISAVDVSVSGLTLTVQLKDGSGDVVSEKSVELPTGGSGTDANLDDLIVTNSISMGRKTGTNVGKQSVAEGYDTTATGYYSHAEGSTTTASGGSSHAEGYGTAASGLYSHAGGHGTKATGESSHAEGNNTTASEKCSHAEGHGTMATGYYSHAEGYASVARGGSSHAEGYGTKAMSSHQHVQGKYNVEDTTNKYAHIVGGGTSDYIRKNIHTLDWQGNAEYEGTVKSAGLILADTVTGQECMLTVADGNLQITPV